MSLQEKDNYFNVVALPIEEQRGLTNEEQLANIDKIFEGKNIEKDFFTTHPLTTDIIGRGYPASEKEIETIKLVNEHEQKLLSENPDIKPIDEGYTYYIIEDGRIFKTDDDVICYGLDFTDMTWVDDANLTSILYDSFLRFSKLYNFRDYYSIKKKDKLI